MSTPYKDSARAYYEAGWSPIPLPHEEKSPPPSKFANKDQMFTGVGGAYVTEEHIKVWLSAKGRAQAGNMSYVPGNIGLRLPAGVLGIDVDAYGTKKGEETLAAAELDWGALPPTWVSTSKDDGISGIRLFRIPPGLKWPGELPQGKGVELIRWDHRYAVVAPSIHDKTKRPYGWFKETEVLDADGEGNPDTASFVVKMVASPDEFPDAPLSVDGEEEGEEAGECDIPWLPTEWVEGLTGLQVFAEDEVNEGLDGAALNRWLAERNDPDSPCSHMRKMMTRWSVSVQKAADDGGAHDEMRDAIWGALNDAKAGHSGIIKVLTHLRNVFLTAVKDRRPDEGAAKSEWARAVLRGGKKVTADANDPEEEDPCDAISSRTDRGGSRKTAGTTGGREGGSGSSSGKRGGYGGSSMEDPGKIGSRDIEECTEVGNANRLVRVMNGRARWVEAYSAWYLWDSALGIWYADDSRQVDRWSVKAINGIDEELAFLQGGEDGEAMVKAYKAHRKASLKVGSIRAMQDMTKGRKGIMLSADLLDADPTLLAVGNGVIRLGEVDSSDAVKLLPISPEHNLTMSARRPYRPEALRKGGNGRLWDEFLKRFLPDEEVREWLQRITGYSLLGRNPGRFLVVLKGLTSTGKSTFAEAIRTVLGDYGALMTASMLRDNIDDKPRPDLLSAFGKRIIVAEELGAAQHLHADQMKRLTGGTPVTARGMRSNTYISKVPAFTPWIVCNEVPTIEGADNALKRRIIVVPFDVQIPQDEEDINYFTRLIEESGEAILAWAVAGHAAYLARPNLGDIPAGALAAAAEFAEGMNDFGAWVAGRVDVGEEFYELPFRLYQDYQEWCGDNGVKEKDQMSNTAFGRKLNGMGIQRTRRSIEGKQVEVRSGIRLTKKEARNRA